MINRKIPIAIILLFIILIPTGCQKSHTPKEKFESYMTAWRKNDFSSMYKNLSIESKKYITEKSFVDKYKQIYGDSKISNISIRAEYPEKFIIDKNKTTHFPINVSMDTIAGKVQFTEDVVLSEEKQDKTKDWFVNWKENMIFPEVEANDKVKVDTASYKAKRGEIKDRNGKGLAVNDVILQVGAVPSDIQNDKSAFANQLAGILNITPQQVLSKLNVSWAKGNVFVPITYIYKSDSDKLSKLQGIKGVITQKKVARVYPYKDAAAHLIGYTGALTEQEYNKLKDKGYFKDDIIGKTGLEQIYESRLRGENGALLYIADSKGNKKKTIAQKLQKDGENINLTIDADVQQSIYSQFNGDAGLSTSVNPTTGEVLALVSSPSYDPNMFLFGVTDKQWNMLSNDPKKPLLNRFSGAYIPGSVFKPITAAIGLNTDKIIPDKGISISGKNWQPNSSWGKYYITRVAPLDKPVNLTDAFVYSDNIYFAQAALSIGKDDFSKGVSNFGMGEKIPFAYPMQKSQLSADGNINSDIQLADSGYGQGKILMNPLHMALVYGMFVNNGDILNPILELKDKAQTPSIWKHNVISKEMTNTILQDLIQVIDNPNGTGHGCKIEGISIAGKTGTPEFKQSADDKNGKENGWFAALNVNNPKIVVVMMIEDVKDRGESHYVVPKVKNVLEQYLK